MPMTEMEAEIRKAEIEAKAKVDAAHLASTAAIMAARSEQKSRKWRDPDFQWFVGILALLMLIAAIVGGFLLNHRLYTEKYAETVKQCQDAGGSWEVKSIPILDSHGDNATKEFETCVRK